MSVIIKEVVDIQFYRLNDLYRKLKDAASNIEKDLLDLDIAKLNKQKQLLEINEKIRKIESEILSDIERY